MGERGDGWMVDQCERVVVVARMVVRCVVRMECMSLWRSRRKRSVVMISCGPANKEGRV